MLNTKTLFSLIKSLTGSEKRLFKLQATLQSGAKNYMQLFELLEELEDFDEASLQQLFKERNADMNLLGTQTYLYQKIMDMLCSKEEEDWIDTKLNKWLLEAKILSQRGFNHLSNDLLKKAKKLAAKYCKHLFLLEILKEEASLNIVLKTKKLRPKIEEIFQEVQYYLNELYMEMMYRERSFWLYSLVSQTAFLKDKASQDEVEEFIQEPIMQIPPSEDASFYVQLFYHKIWLSYYYSKGDAENRILTSEKITALWERFPEQRKVEMNEYIISNSNLVIAYTHTLSEKIPPILDQLENMTALNFYDEAQLFQNITHLKLYYYLNLKDYKAAQALANNIEDKLPVYEHLVKQSRLLSIYYNVMLCFFLDKDYDSAFNWLDKILAITRTDEMRVDLMRIAQIFQLAIFYEQGELDLLESLIRSVSRNKLVKEGLAPFEKLVIKYFKKLQRNLPNSKEALFIKKQFYDKLKELPAEQAKLPGFNDFVTWLELFIKQEA